MNARIEVCAQLLLSPCRSAKANVLFQEAQRMASLESLDDLLQDELRDMYDAEKQLTKALPKMAKKATSEELKHAFEEHLSQTEQHDERHEQAFEQLDIPARGT